MIWCHGNSSKKSDQHSFKEDHYGTRFTSICDANQKVRKLYGPYSPKVDDNTFMDLMRDSIESSTTGAVIIGDCGYEQVVRKFQKIKIITTIAKKRGRKPKNGEGITKLTKQQKAFNKRLKALRARVESPFGHIKQKWKCLSTCFYEGDEYQGYLVKLAMAIINFEKK